MAARDSGTLRLEFWTEDKGALRADRRPDVSRLDWLVSGLALQRKDGSWIEGRDWFGYLSAGERRLQVESDGVPAEDFRAIRFRVGIDPATDQGDPAAWPPGHALNPAVNHLHWGWQGGYVFLALDGRSVSSEWIFGRCRKWVFLPPRRCVGPDDGRVAG